MDDIEARPRRRWYETRWPALYYLLSAVWVAFLVTVWMNPAQDTWRLVTGTLTGTVLAAGFAAMATLTLVARSRGALATEPTPLAQENDPRLR